MFFTLFQHSTPSLPSEASPGPSQSSICLFDHKTQQDNNTKLPYGGRENSNDFFILVSKHVVVKCTNEEQTEFNKKRIRNAFGSYDALSQGEGLGAG